MVIFLYAEHSLAFETIIEGKEYKFWYRLKARGWEKFNEHIKDRKNYDFQGDLTIKALPGNILECQMTEVWGEKIKYLDELKEKFTVKLDGEKVLEINSTGISTEEGNQKKKEMIENIIKDRSDIVRLIKEGNADTTATIEMPIVGKCVSQLSEEMKEDKKAYRAQSINKNCVIEEQALAIGRKLGYSDGGISEVGQSEVRLMYDPETNKQIGLGLRVQLGDMLTQTIWIDSNRDYYYRPFMYSEDY